MVAKKSYFRKFIIVLLLGFSALGFLASVFLVDGPNPPRPDWAIAVVRDETAVAAMQQVYALDVTPLTALSESDQVAMSRGAVEFDGIVYDDWDRIREVVTDAQYQLNKLHSIISGNDKLTNGRETVSRFAESSPIHIPQDLIILLRLELGLAVHDGRMEDAVRLALHGLKFGKLLLEGKGTMLHLVVANTAYRIAQLNANFVIRKTLDPELLRKLVAGMRSLCVTDDVFVNAIVVEYEFGETTADEEYDLEVLKVTDPIGFEDCSKRFLWLWPELFYKENDTSRLDTFRNTELVANAAKPTRDWTQNI